LQPNGICVMFRRSIQSPSLYAQREEIGEWYNRHDSHCVPTVELPLSIVQGTVERSLRHVHRCIIYDSKSADSVSRSTDPLRGKLGVSALDATVNSSGESLMSGKTLFPSGESSFSSSLRLAPTPHRHAADAKSECKR